jgi:hypothetical protein
MVVNQFPPFRKAREERFTTETQRTHRRRRRKIHRKGAKGAKERKEEKTHHRGTEAKGRARKEGPAQRKGRNRSRRRNAAGRPYNLQCLIMFYHPSAIINILLCRQIPF